MIAKLLTQRRVISIFLIFVLAFSLVFLEGEPAIADAAIASAENMGAWEDIPMPPLRERIQSVHTILLPNGKVLMVNGSSFRSTLVKDNNEEYKFIEGVDLTKYDVVNNTGLLDPKTGTFERIGSPLTHTQPDSKELQANTTNDLFCAGHVQLDDGNVLFVGGTGRYYPGGAFTGTKWLNLYKWEENTWEVLGEMKDGRWYPSLIPLHDGKVAIFSGLKFEQPNQINPSLEIYDPKTNELLYFDLRDIRNSPFNTLLEEDAYDTIDLYPRVFSLADGRLLITGDDGGIAGVLLPLFSKKSYLMTIEKELSAEKCTDAQKCISFEVGPDRQETSKAYGTALQIPNSEEVLLLGGIIGTNSIDFGRGGDTGGFPGARVATSLQHWISPQKGVGKNGKWEIVDNFLDKPRANLQAVILPSKEILVINGGEYPEYKPVYEPLLMTPNEDVQTGYETKLLNPAKLPRLYHNGAILLPDARVLVVGGNTKQAAREEDGTVHVDILPDPDNYYRFAELNNSSGQAEEFNLETYYQDPQHYFVEGDQEPFVPAEIWQGEVFSPPYLYKPGQRPEIETELETINYGEPGQIIVKNGTNNGSLVLNKLGSVTHSFDYGQRLVDLPINEVSKFGDSTKLTIKFQAPTNAHLYPPGYYMMFYLNDIGKPSHAKIVKLETKNDKELCKKTSK
ncbi:galactose oxidase early set domain-containing protein [Moorena bouillonii]|uniref:Uncharacterized protein n=1 Tax=Moorena bouillonii PNG TaxID=568701 RepID=A0A1U7N3L0_9CYAN|nr:galactose oxidase early set domain-containing protein [Moorena bouillonii]OLT60543.1 hypothetical protein BJP37_17515 [Moorena bouillonii PNG]